MRKPKLLLLLSTLAIALPLSASEGHDQSYFTFSDGGTIVRQAEDGRDIDARVNLPVFPGDEVITNRRGRAEIRLADGNILALDRSTDVIVHSVLGAYDSDAQQTVVELRYGHVAVQRTDFNEEALRLDTQNASYAASDPAVYAVETDSDRADRVLVFDGQVEVRTPTRTTVLREGEEGSVDSEGLYGLVSQRDDADEFERWFIRRTERYTGDKSAYLDSTLAYSDADLQEYGSWTFVSSLGTWGWRPYVSAGWRPYYFGNWIYGPNGCLVWFSDEPWGWVPYHYGRWAYDPIYGWVWVPGYTYSPAWVYWIYGPGYLGWAPAGWFDCYRPYYGWAYQPYMRAGFDFGFGFYGRVHLNEIDLRPWTFVSPDHIISTRVDQAALTTDVIRQRFLRDPSAGIATVGATPARFTRAEIRDPAAAIGVIARRGIGNGPGRGGSAPVTDLTPFFRRDAQLPNTIRERIVRSGGPSGGGVVAPTTRGGITAPPARPTPSGVPSPGTPGTIEGRVPARGDKDTTTGRIDRNVGGRTPVAGEPPVTPQIAPPPSGTGRVPVERRTPPSGNTAPSGDRGTAPTWRDRVVRPAPSTPSAPPEQKPSTDRTPPPDRSTPPPSRPTIDRTPPPDRSTPPPPSAGESWRTRSSSSGQRDTQFVPRDRTPVERYAPVDRGNDIPRRIIDRIGGARIYGEPAAPSTPRVAPAERSSPPPARERSSSPPPSRSSGGGGGHGKKN